MTMLEKMAKAAWADVSGLDEKMVEWRELYPDRDPETSPDTWPETMMHSDADAFRSAARAALLSIREPDDTLLQPGCAKHTPGEPMSDEHAVECPAFVRRRRIWKEQIDSILNTTTGGGNG